MGKPQRKRACREISPNVRTDLGHAADVGHARCLLYGFARLDRALVRKGNRGSLNGKSLFRGKHRSYRLPYLGRTADGTDGRDDGCRLPRPRGGGDGDCRCCRRLPSGCFREGYRLRRGVSDSDAPPRCGEALRRKRLSGRLFHAGAAPASACGALAGNLIGAGREDVAMPAVRRHARLTFMIVPPAAGFPFFSREWYRGCRTMSPDLTDAAVLSLRVCCAAPLSVASGRVRSVPFPVRATPARLLSRRRGRCRFIPCIYTPPGGICVPMRLGVGCPGACAVRHPVALPCLPAWGRSGVEEGIKRSCPCSSGRFTGLCCPFGDKS